MPAVNISGNSGEDEMRIAYFSPTSLAAENGIARRLIETLRALRTFGHEALVVVPQTAGQPKEVCGFPVVAVPAFSLPCYPAFRCSLPCCNRTTLQTFRAFRADVLHALDPVTGLGWIARQLAAQSHCPLVTSYHTNLPAYLHFYHAGWLEPLSWHYVRFMHRHASLTLCPSAVTQQDLLQHGIVGAQLWKAGVSTERFHPSRQSSAWRNRLTEHRSTRTLLLFVGRLAAEKRIDTLFALLDALSDCHLAIVGEGPQRSQLERLAGNRPVTFLGHLDEDALAEAYASADILVQPSISETFGNVTLEAMASGLPVVAAAAGGTLDLIAHQQTGLLYPAESPQAFQRAVRLLSEAEPLRKSLSQAARERAEHHSWQATTAGLCQLYRRIINISEVRKASA
jgi:phosphatidylinositol alpha 1,6-mannosyltransferase